MNREQATSLVRECLHEIAPDIDIDTVSVDADYREVLALDSLDFLQLVEQLSNRSGQRIDEADYPQLATIAATIGFLAEPQPREAPR